MISDYIRSPLRSNTGISKNIPLRASPAPGIPAFQVNSKKKVTDACNIPPSQVNYKKRLLTPTSCFSLITNFCDFCCMETCFQIVIQGRPYCGPYMLYLAIILGPQRGASTDGRGGLFSRAGAYVGHTPPFSASLSGLPMTEPQ